MYEDQIPTFMSVFDLDAETMVDRETVTLLNPKLIEIESTCAPSTTNTLSAPNQQSLRPTTMPQDPMHKHHDSTSTQTSESADSSPTTTLSTTDSSPLSDPSPSSSPESPINLLPLSSFPATAFGGLSSMASLNLSEPPTLERPVTSPSPRRPRNMKGLFIQPPSSATGSVATAVPAPAPAPAPLASEPSSPSFIKPTIPAMKRKPSQLSLKTKSSDLIMRTTLEVPTSPALPPILQRRALKHSTSSPHMLSSLKSSTFGPAGGMTFPKVLERNESGLSELLRPTKLNVSGALDSTILEEDSPIKTQLANRAALDFEPFHEIENGEDQKSPGYPDGPIAIYEDNVFLYLEPTAEEASKFDVVINVAREVANPFKAATQTAGKSDESLAPRPEAAENPISNSAVAGTSYPPGFEYLTSEDAAAETPTTPKAMFAAKEPEYIHMPWDHNTDIAVDLMQLCETVEQRTQEGKRVLIHCQQGASRSASLIIAYGMYRNPRLSVNDAYYAAQAKSRWISPNMKLMYCLQDFQKEVSRKKLPLGSAFGQPRTGRSPTKHRLTLSADGIDLSPKDQLAPSSADDRPSIVRSPSADARSSPINIRRASTASSQPLSPGPSSAPSCLSWSEKDDDKDSDKRAKFSFERFLTTKPEPAPADSGFSPTPNFFARPPPSPGFVPPSLASPTGFTFTGLSLNKPLFGHADRSDSPPLEREISILGAYPDDEALMSPRAETMTSNPLHDAFSDMAGLRFVEVPPTPNDPDDELFSPRQTMFPRDPFFPFGRPTQITDPRSPPTKGETPIVRSIDELL